MNTWALQQIKPDASLEAKMTKPKLPCFRHLRKRQGGLFGKDNTAGKNRGGRRRGRPSTRYTDSSTEATGGRPQELSRAVEDRTVWTPLIRRVARS